MPPLPHDESGLRTFLASAPDSAEAHAALGNLLLNSIGIVEGAPISYEVAPALMHLRDALNLGDRSLQTIEPFIRTLTLIKAIPNDWDMTTAFVRALEANVLTHSSFVPVALALVRGAFKHDGAFASALDMAERGDEEAIALALDSLNVRDALAHPAFTAILRLGLVKSFALEPLLMRARRRLLTSTFTEDTTSIHPSDRVFCAALADQCFLAEYVDWQDSDELTMCDALANRFGKALSEDPLTDPFPASVLACYGPISSHPWADVLARAYPENTPHDFSTLVQRHIHEPALERSLAQSIPEVTLVSDKTSALVKQQYEENPYPRWIAHVQLPKQPFREAVRAKFPTADFSRLDQIATPEILIAGCGTGLQILRATSTYYSWALTAIDLSRASLAYAKRQMEIFNVRNVNFLVCDILNISHLKQSFDIIDCVGVLHHMADPLAGWRALTESLRPGGIMTVGLYSKTARSGVAATRNYARRKGYDGTLDGIRKIRRDVLSAIRQPPDLRDDDEKILANSEITRFVDFYTSSMLRDLIFHVQECAYTLPELQTALENLGLRFLGFRFRSNKPLKAYHTRFPNDPRGDNLENWAIFEQENPDTFSGMYVFGVQKPGPELATADSTSL